jgi:hypothetical protein
MTPEDLEQAHPVPGWSDSTCWHQASEHPYSRGRWPTTPRRALGRQFPGGIRIEAVQTFQRGQLVAAGPFVSLPTTTELDSLWVDGAGPGAIIAYLAGMSAGAAQATAMLEQWEPACLPGQIDLSEMSARGARHQLRALR